MNVDWSQITSCLILSMRNLGDTIPLTGFINAVKQTNPAISFDVLGKPSLEHLTRKFSHIDQYMGFDFPLYGHHQRDAASLRRSLKHIQLVRKTKYDICIDLQGDFREHLIGFITGAKRFISPAWPANHPYNNHMRSPYYALAHTIPMLEQLPNYYDSIAYFAQQLRLPPLQWPTRSEDQRPLHHPPIIGLHPGASHPSKQWDWDRWKSLIAELSARDYHLLIFGSPSDEAALRSHFADELQLENVTCVTQDISRFIDTLADIDLLVGMDSFSVHAAYAMGVVGVMLHGPFDPRVMTPPGDVPLSAGQQCAYHPCNNGTSCKNEQYPYICIRDISVETVLQAIDNTLKQRSYITGSFSHPIDAAGL